MPEGSPGFGALADRLKGDAPLKVWSVIATIFGDLAARQDAEIAGPYLSALAGHMGIRAPALRVALHRLKNEGWIASRRLGRTGLHRLTPRGLAETRAVRTRVYGPGPDGVIPLHLSVGPPGAKAMPADTVRILPEVWLGPAGPGAAERMTGALDAADVPPWVHDRLVPSALGDAYGALDAALAYLEHHAASFAGLTEMERVTLRLLIIHRWRRLLLRHPAWAEAAMPPGWAGACCRQRVRSLLGLLPAPAEGALVAPPHT